MAFGDLAQPHTLGLRSSLRVPTYLTFNLSSRSFTRRMRQGRPHLSITMGDDGLAL